MSKHVKTDSAACSFDCSDFHATCKGCTVIDQGGRLWLFCTDCKVLANAEAVGTRITPESSKGKNDHGH